MQAKGSLQVRGDLLDRYADVLTPSALDAMAALEHFDADRRQLMQARIERRLLRARERERISFLPADTTIGRTTIRVSDARAGRFDGSDIPADLQRQWIQGTGPAARPRASTAESIRNVAYALLSGADGWMFDGEDALAADFRERVLPMAREVARTWALREMGIDDADEKAFAAMGISL